MCQFRLSLNFPLTYLVTGGLTLFHQTEVVRAIPARSCCQGGDGGADMEHASGLGHKHLAYSDSSLSKFSGPFTVFRKQLLFDVSLVDDQDAVLLLTSSHILRLSSGYSLLYGMVLFWFSV